jgi:N-acetylglucosaminyl-diphospho-decaprenol L-rhamnosyltransferase
MPSVLTIVLNWRTPEMTLDAVAAALIALEGIEGALVVVDNDSQDGSFEQIAAGVQTKGWDQGPHPVRVVQAGRNGGYGAGNNFGIRTGLPGGQKPDFVYILNSDAFPEKGTVRALLDHMVGHPKTAFAGSVLYGKEGEHHNTAFRFPSIASEFESQIRFGPVSRIFAKKLVVMTPPTTEAKVQWMAGASLMARRTALDQIGLFDETFFLYFEETDLCHRAINAGWDCIFVPTSRAMHLGSVSTGMRKWQRIPQYWLDSRLHYFVKNHGFAYTLFATLALLTGGVIWRLRLLVQRKDRQDPPYFLRDLTLHALKACAAALRRGGAKKVQALPGE